VVAGAYRATPVRNLETETWIPPLDLYLNTQVAQFERRLQNSRAGKLIQQSGAAVARILRQRRGRPPKLTEGKYRDEVTLATWAEMWAPGDTSPKAAADQAWRLHWQGEYERARGKWPT
jgi:hypothetical protein